MIVSIEKNLDLWGILTPFLPTQELIKNSRRRGSIGLDISKLILKEFFD